MEEGTGSGEMKKYDLHISVRELVEFIFREGDIDNRGGRIQTADAMLEGSKIHKKIQGSMGPGYRAEVPLRITEEGELYDLTIEGRADGIFTERWTGENEVARFTERWTGENEVARFGEATVRFEPGRTVCAGESGKLDGSRITAAANGSGETDRAEPSEGQLCTWIDEIKGTYRMIERMEKPDYVHIAQAMCYGYIYAVQNGLSGIGVQITYCHMEPDHFKGYQRATQTEERRYFRAWFSIGQITEWYDALLAQYRKWADFRYQWREERQASIKGLSFPYEYRKGQYKLAGDVYRTILRRKTLFLQAPTGAGKTLCTVFPAVKAVGEELAERIFYLTAKTVAATVAMEAFALLAEHGYRGKVIRITAKEKICFCDEADCNPVHCPVARGHYDRVNDAVYAMICAEDVLSREVIRSYAEQYRVCPFEMGLDAALFMDVVVCDYNYAFDPNVMLKRFFQEGGSGDHLLLVDEAHNLIGRSREMYSAWIVKEDVLAVRRLLRERGSRKLLARLDECNRRLLEYKRKCESYRKLEDGIGNLYFSLFLLREELEEFLQDPADFSGRKDVLDFYFALRQFLEIYGLVDGHYVVYSQLMEDGRFGIRLFCVDPSANLQKCIDKSRSAIFFSATLLPVQYYRNMLCEEEDSYAVYAESCFDPGKRLLLLGRDASTRYSRRNDTEYGRIARYIHSVIRCRAGNYMVFFPSYQVMEEIYGQFQLLDPQMECRSVLQASGMGEQEREEFLALFEEQSEFPFAAFCVLGGIFGEGIDLKNDRLIGCIIIGTGLPGIGVEQEILKNYFDERLGSGFDYAFLYPGMNKVLQAAGRVIRTMEDEGIILLLDERFLRREYQELFPREWEQRQVCTLEDVEERVRVFWNRKKI